MATVWEEDQEDEIIDYVRARPCFYDTSSTEYKDRELRSAEWEKLAGKFGVEVGVMQRKWKALNDQFNRCEKTKKSKKSGDGADGKYQPKWVHYEKMRFLAPYRAPRETQMSIKLNVSGLEKESEDDPMVVDDEQDGKDVQERREFKVPSQQAMPPPSTPLGAKKRKVNNDPCSPGVDDLFRKTLSQITEQMSKEPSEIQLFTDDVGAQLSKLSLRRQLRAKDAIQQVVSRALDEQYAEEEEAERMQRGSASPQILPPTQATQSPYYHYAHASGPPSTSSSYSGSEMPLSTTASLLSEVGASLYSNAHYNH